MMHITELLLSNGDFLPLFSRTRINNQFYTSETTNIVVRKTNLPSKNGCYLLYNSQINHLREYAKNPLYTKIAVKRI